MKSYCFLLLLIAASIVHGQDTVQYNIFHSPSNIRLFADDLFCKHDYLRSVDEYENYLKMVNSDTVKIKIGYSYLYMEKSKEAGLKLKPEIDNPVLEHAALKGYCRSLFMDENYCELKNVNDKYGLTFPAVAKLNAFAGLMPDMELSKDKTDFMKNFGNDEYGSISGFYEKASNPRYASPLKAALLSAVIPGAGKIYAGQTSDGIISAAITGLFAFLAYDNFHASHKFRAWLFTGIGSFFYSSTVYGSAAQAVIHNAEVDYKFTIELKSFLAGVNYFMGKDPEFCK